MYSSLKNVQIIVALLKKYNIKNIVLSAGTRHTPLVYSVEHDNFFKTYSVVDERSASFFALGMIEFLQEPVAICCTSGTAAANYVSAANEAFFQQLPLVILTADRNPYYMYQQEEQMIPQLNLFKDVCKKVVSLPIVRDEKDFWYCSRLVNEALMELEHKDKGPIHINFPVENDYPEKQAIVNFSTEELPDVKKVERYCLDDKDSKWEKLSREVSDKKILIIYGQHGVISEEDREALDDFCERYNCFVSADLLSNLHSKYALNTFPILRFTELPREMRPDIVITFYGHTVSDIKTKLKYFSGYEHWHVSKEGVISDPFKILPNVFECTPTEFFKKMSSFKEKSLNNEYNASWHELNNLLSDFGGMNELNIDYSSVYATQQYLKSIPADSLLHIANSNSVRIANYFSIDDSVQVFGNRGAHGIDGSMSAFIGQANISGKLSFLIIGDLSFFYDMNSLWNAYVGKNVRIMVCNNSGGAIFHTYPNAENVPTLDEHIAAEHHTSVKGWALHQGFNYLSALDKEEFDKNLPLLMTKDSDKPVIMEVFTDKDIDASIISGKMYDSVRQNKQDQVHGGMLQGLKKAVKKVIR